MPPKNTPASEQLAECKEELAVLKQDLAEVRDTAPHENQRLLDAGLRLAMENAALRDQIAELTDEMSRTNTDSINET